MNKESLAAYLRKFSFVCLYFLDPIKGANNYKEEISLLTEYAQKSVQEEKLVCFLSKTERDCREFTEPISSKDLEKISTFSVNEILFLGPTPKYNTELTYPSDIIIVHLLEQYPKLDLLKGRMKILLTTKSFAIFEAVGKMNPNSERIILRYQNDDNLFTMDHLSAQK